MSTTAEIEMIVRRVLTRMLAGDSPSILRIQHSPITLASIPSDLTGIREVHIPSQAIVTPAVCDVLRNAKVSIVRSNDSSATFTKNERLTQPTSHTSSSSFSSLQPLIITGSADYMPAITRTICPRQALVLSKAHDDATALREAAVGLRNGHRAAVILGSAAHALAWQAARDEKLRPVVVTQWTQLAETLAEVPTNLVILSSKHWNALAASNVIRAFYKHLIQS